MLVTCSFCKGIFLAILMFLKDLEPDLHRNNGVSVGLVSLGETKMAKTCIFT